MLVLCFTALLSLLVLVHSEQNQCNVPGTGPDADLCNQGTPVTCIGYDNGYASGANCYYGSTGSTNYGVSGYCYPGNYAVQESGSEGDAVFYCDQCPPGTTSDGDPFNQGNGQLGAGLGACYITDSNCGNTKCYIPTTGPNKYSNPTQFGGQSQGVTQSGSVSCDGNGGCIYTCANRNFGAQQTANGNEYTYCDLCPSGQSPSSTTGMCMSLVTMAPRVRQRRAKRAARAARAARGGQQQQQQQERRRRRAT